ncbi:MAG: GNAT family N-acetyltransferase, partial [Halanaerobiales bacterium]
EARLVKYDELERLLDLYKHLNDDDPVLQIDVSLKLLWEKIFNDPNLYYIVIEQGNKLISSCTLAVVKNLTRGARPYGLIENVVTDPDFRKKGYGSKVLKKAISICQQNNCYKVMLLTGSKKEATLDFYEKAGFSRKVKTGFYKKL